jgi:hypothetical protein
LGLVILNLDRPAQGGWGFGKPVVGGAVLCEQIFDVSVDQVEATIEPDSVGDDIGRESVALICVHLANLSISAS